MNTNQPDGSLPPQVEAALDDLLTAWAAPRRLSTEQANRIREAILENSASAEPARPDSPELESDWWCSMMADIARAVRASVVNLGGSSAGLAAVASSFGQPTWGQPDENAACSPGTFRLYLRLQPLHAESDRV